MRYMVKCHERKRNFILAGLLISSIFILFPASANPFFRFTPWPDCSVFSIMGWLARDGAIPYRDYFDHKGPLMYLINGLFGYGHNFWTIWIYEFFSLFTTSIFMYKLARLRFDSTISFLATLSALLLIGRNLDGGNYTEEYAVLFISIGIYVCVKILLDKDRLIWWRGVVNGIACGAVLLLRPNMAGAWVVLCVIIFFRYILQRQIKNSLLFALYFLLGISIACMPVLLYFHVNEGMQDFIFSYFIFNFGYSNIDNSFMNSLNGMFVQIRAMAIDGSLFTILIGCILCIYQGLKTKKERVFWWSIPFAFFVSFYFASMSGKGYAHYRMILAPLMIIPMALLFRYAYSFVKKHLCKGFIKKAHAIAIPLVLLMVLNIGLIAYNGGMFILRIPENRRRTVCLEDAASFLNTNMLESDQLLV